MLLDASNILNCFKMCALKFHKLLDKFASLSGTYLFSLMKFKERYAFTFSSQKTFIATDSNVFILVFKISTNQNSPKFRRFDKIPTESAGSVKRGSKMVLLQYNAAQQVNMESERSTHIQNKYHGLPVFVNSNLFQLLEF